MLLEYKLQSVWTLHKIISIIDEEFFSERPSGAPLHNVSKFYYVPFCNPSLFLTSVLVHLQPTYGGLYSISDDLSKNYYGAIPISK